MADFENRQGPYKGWPEPLRRERLARLLRIVNRHIIGSVSVSVERNRYDAIVDEEMSRLVGGPYGLLAMQCFIVTSRIIEDHRQQLKISGNDYAIAYMLEDGAIGKGQIMKAYEGVKGDKDKREITHITSLTFAGKREIRPLQAADIVAYETYKEVVRRSQNGTRPVRYPLEQLRTSPHEWIHSSEEFMRDRVRVFNNVAGRAEESSG